MPAICIGAEQGIEESPKIKTIDQHENIHTFRPLYISLPFAVPSFSCGGFFSDSRSPDRLPFSKDRGVIYWH